ncbi:C40 family peptidase [Paenibacillus sp. CMAA1364]
MIHSWTTPVGSIRKYFCVSTTLELERIFMKQRATIIRYLLTILISIMIVVVCVSCNTTKKYSVMSADEAVTLTDKDLYIDTLGVTWVPLQSVVQSLGLHMKDSNHAVTFGYTDPMYEINIGKRQALSLGSSTMLDEAPTRWKGQPYMSLNSLAVLLNTSVTWDQANHKIAISSLQDTPTTTSSSDPIQEDSIRMLSTTIDKNAFIAYAKKYLSVPYEFGAQPYDQSKTFDCSSFTQHVFNKFNVDLPRLARDQGHVGVSTTRDKLKPGDLIFFTVPGRFKSNSIPGHVGIYIGNGQFIHTWGQPGVQISSVDNGYWSNVILYMRSVI